jgi:hypothetical protein
VGIIIQLEYARAGSSYLVRETKGSAILHQYFGNLQAMVLPVKGQRSPSIVMVRAAFNAVTGHQRLSTD